MASLSAGGPNCYFLVCCSFSAQTNFSSCLTFYSALSGFDDTFFPRTAFSRTLRILLIDAAPSRFNRRNIDVKVVKLRGYRQIESHKDGIRTEPTIDLGANQKLRWTWELLLILVTLDLFGQQTKRVFQLRAFQGLMRLPWAMGFEVQLFSLLWFRRSDCIVACAGRPFFDAFCHDGLAFGSD